MGTHHSPAQQQAQLASYHRQMQITLDMYMHGEISQDQALTMQHAAAALLTDCLRSAFLVRLRNLESFQTSKGHSGPPVGR